MFTSETPLVAKARSRAGPIADGSVTSSPWPPSAVDHLVVADPGAELGHDVVSEQRLHRVLLEPPDPVVADDRDDVHAVPHERLEVAEREADRAVAEQQHDLAIGMGDTGRERVTRAHPQAAVRTRVEERAGHVAVDELPRVRDEVAAVADHDRVARQPLAQLAVDTRGLDRRGIRFEHRHLGGALGPLVVAQERDPVVTRRRRRSRLRERLERGGEIAGGRRREIRVRRDL